MIYCREFLSLSRARRDINVRRVTTSCVRSRGWVDSRIRCAKFRVISRQLVSVLDYTDNRTVGI